MLSCINSDQIIKFGSEIIRLPSSSYFNNTFDYIHNTIEDQRKTLDKTNLWTVDDLSILILLYNRGNSILNIAKILNRTNNAITSKLIELGCKI